MTKMVYHSRIVSDHDNHTCTQCGHLDHTGSESTLDLPYCGACGKVVLDINQSYCCWCGEKIQP